MLVESRSFSVHCSVQLVLQTRYSKTECSAVYSRHSSHMFRQQNQALLHTRCSYTRSASGQLLLGDWRPWLTVPHSHQHSKLIISHTHNGLSYHMFLVLKATRPWNYSIFCFITVCISAVFIHLWLRNYQTHSHKTCSVQYATCLETCRQFSLMNMYFLDRLLGNHLPGCMVSKRKTQILSTWNCQISLSPWTGK